MRSSLRPTGAAGRTPNEIDAAVVEVVVLALKRERPRLYRVVWQRYMARRGDVLAADRLRMSVYRYRQMMFEGFRWLSKRLPSP